MAVESAGCPYVKIPVPIQDTYSVAEIAILLRVSRNAVYEWSLLEDDPEDACGSRSIRSVLRPRLA